MGGGNGEWEEFLMSGRGLDYFIRAKNITEFFDTMIEITMDQY